MSAKEGPAAVKRVVQAAAAFVESTGDQPIRLAEGGQSVAFEQLCAALQDLTGRVKKA